MLSFSLAFSLRLAVQFSCLCQCLFLSQIVFLSLSMFSVSLFRLSPPFNFSFYHYSSPPLCLILFIPCIQSNLWHAPLICILHLHIIHPEHVNIVIGKCFIHSIQIDYISSCPFIDSNVTSSGFVSFLLFRSSSGSFKRKEWHLRV